MPCLLDVHRDRLEGDRQHLVHGHHGMEVHALPHVVGHQHPSQDYRGEGGGVSVGPRTDLRPERRRRGLKRGRHALDALDALKLALLAGIADSGALASLKVAASALGESSGDPGLDSVLAESERALTSPEPGQRPGVVRRLIEDRQVHGDGLGWREFVGRQYLQVADIRGQV